MTGKRVAIVIAAYNEATSIATVVRGLKGYCDWCIVVCDGSRDDTASVALAAGARVLRHVVNRGQGAALLTGIRDAVKQGADVVVTFDADGQHDPLDIAALVEPIAMGQADVALGSRFLGRAVGIPLTRRWMLKAGVVITRVLSGIWVTDVANGLRAFSSKAAGELVIKLDRFAHASEILDQIGVHRWRFVEVPVTIHYTAYSMAKGQSSWNAVRIVAQLLLQRRRP
jgi:glycosyltransferase involved in cell wall biosynthesis